jgi:hypothetical protein
MSLEALIAEVAALARSRGDEPTPRALAEAVWLLDVTTTQAVAAPTAPAPEGQELEDLDLDDDDEPALTSERSPDPGDGVELEETNSPDESLATPLPTISPAPLFAPSLRPRLVDRSLHGFARRDEVGPLLLDVPATVARSARARAVLPVLRRAERPISHLLVLIDTARQLEPWRADIDGLVAGLERARGFVSTRVLALDLSHPQRAIVAPWRERDRIQAMDDPLGASRGAIQAAARAGGDLLVLVVSDGVGAATTSGALGQTLALLPPRARVAWVHPWPEKRWHRTRVGRLLDAAPGAAWTCRVLPIVEWTRTGLGRLASWVQQREVPGLRILSLPPGPPPAWLEPPAQEQLAPGAWQDRARRFLLASEPATAQLLGVLAGVPGWTDEALLERLVQSKDLSPGAGAAGAASWAARHHMAEALASGFLRRTDEGHGHLTVAPRGGHAQSAALTLLPRADLAFLWEQVWEELRDDEERAARLGVPRTTLGKLLGRPGPADQARLDAEASYESFLPLVAMFQQLQPELLTREAWLTTTAKRVRKAELVQELAALGGTSATPTALVGPGGGPTALTKDDPPKATAKEEVEDDDDVTERTDLLETLQRCLTDLIESLRERLQDPRLAAELEAEYREATRAERTGDPYLTWLDDRLAQVASSWVLACVFVRFLEDNQLIEPPRLAGPGGRLQQALDEETLYSRRNPSHSHREYLEHVFRDLSSLPCLRELLGPKNPLWTLGPTADGARELLESLRQRNPATRALLHDFTDPGWDTRFLGDLYQDLSELARKRYALLQTPEFVEEFILDRTLEPALAERGLANVSLIDPACGSGHFLLGAFTRLSKRWQQAEPGTPPAALAQRALDQLGGVDVNPFAVAIARFRLLLAALRFSGESHLRGASDFKVPVAAGDSLLHGPRPGRIEGRQEYLLGEDPLGHVYRVEDPDALRKILGRRYTVVVANPPYVTPKDRAQNEAYRKRFGSCHMKYSLAVPFKERCFDLAESPEEGKQEPAGWVGMITANSFIFREFGKKLIEEYVPRWDLTHVLDTSYADIPGHATPTVILLARSRRPVGATVRAVRGIRGEAHAPADPSKGLVWRSIVDLVDRPGTKNDYVSTDDVDRQVYHKHPWPMGGGGAAELKDRLDRISSSRLESATDSIGFMAITAEDDFFVTSARIAERDGLPTRQFVTGDVVRDWCLAPDCVVIFPYTISGDRVVPVEPLVGTPAWKLMWMFRTPIRSRAMFGKTAEQQGKRWFEYLQLIPSRVTAHRLIAFAEVATHNHFHLDRGGRVFKQTAPVIKLRAEATEEDHLSLAGILNSSTTCFWMKQVCYPKGTTTGDISMEKGAPEHNRYAFSSTSLGALPIPPARALEDLAPLVQCIEKAAVERARLEPAEVLRAWAEATRMPLAKQFDDAARDSEGRFLLMVALQEELDWEVYRAFGLDAEGTDRPALRHAKPGAGVQPHMRPAFWTSETPPDGLPTELVELYRRRRRRLVENAALALIETPVFKRPWLGQQGVFGHQNSTYSDRAHEAMRTWLVDRVDDPALWTGEPRCMSASHIADRCRRDQAFMHVAETFCRTADFEPTDLVVELLREEAVPVTSCHRYTETGRRKRAEWDKTWALQRQEDSIDVVSTHPPAGVEGGKPWLAVPVVREDARRLTPEQVADRETREVSPIPDPPRYVAGDFRHQVYWRHRGKLDVPKERFLLVVGAERDTDPTPVFGWAGWDHLQRAQALAALYVERKEKDAWSADRLLPILVAVHELVPWLLQWHDTYDPVYGMGLGTYFKGFVEEEARSIGKTPESLDVWSPEPGKRGRKPPKTPSSAPKTEPVKPRRGRKAQGGSVDGAQNASTPAEDLPAVQPSDSDATKPTTELRHLLGFMPGEFAPTLHAWGWMPSDPRTPEGAKWLEEEFFPRELARAELCYEPQGFLAFARNTDDLRPADARYVILGERAAWFAARFVLRREQILEQLLLIKYVLPLEQPSARRFDSRARRKLPPVHAIPVDVRGLDPAPFARHPSWQPLLQSVEEDAAGALEPERAAEETSSDSVRVFITTTFDSALWWEASGETRKAAVERGPEWIWRTANAERPGPAGSEKGPKRDEGFCRDLLARAEAAGRIRPLSPAPREDDLPSGVDLYAVLTPSVGGYLHERRHAGRFAKVSGMANYEHGFLHLLRLLPPLVCIAHAQSDSRWADQLRERLDPHRRGGLLDVWTGDIELGESWADRFQGAVAKAAIVVTIVTPAFLADPRLRDILRLTAHRVPILLLPARHIAAAAAPPELRAIQPATPWGRPLEALPEEERTEVMARLVERIVELASADPAPRSAKGGVPMNKGERTAPLSRAEFEDRLRTWSGGAPDSAVIGGSAGQGRHPWLWVRSGADLFHLNADATGAGVRTYLALADRHGREMAWHVTTTRSGRATKVVFGPNRKSITRFPLYCANEKPAPLEASGTEGEPDADTGRAKLVEDLSPQLLERFVAELARIGRVHGVPVETVALCRQMLEDIRAVDTLRVTFKQNADGQHILASRGETTLFHLNANPRREPHVDAGVRPGSWSWSSKLCASLESALLPLDRTLKVTPTARQYIESGGRKLTLLSWVLEDPGQRWARVVDWLRG